jgi:transposase
MSKETKKKLTEKEALSFPVIYPNTAGIDISSSMHMVAVPADRDTRPVRQFGCFTEDLHAIAKWLEQCKIERIAMESTGVYWKPLFMLLLEYGFKVSLVNARQIKNVSFHKTDKEDARWIQRLHSCDLLPGSFLPDEPTEQLRTLVRHRRRLLEDSSKYVLRMQKALELMNIKIHGVISDIMGKTGTAIIEAIIAGQRDAAAFLPFVDGRIKASHQTIEKSLTGTWNEGQLFLLAENYSIYKCLQQKILNCDNQIEKQLQQYAAMCQDGIVESGPAPVRTKKTKNQPSFDVKGYLHKIHGVDVTAIYGISESCAMEILSETGTDLSKWENEKKFVSWLNLCPNNKITGGRILSSAVLKKKAGAATQAFRAAANALQKSNHYLGDYFRKMKSKKGNKYAIIATAHKLAVIYYRMLTDKKPFNPIDVDEHREKIKTAKIEYLKRQLEKLQAA